nr:hypothetical protein [Nonomuraea diastatica]
MGYKADYPKEVINGHRTLITRRRATRPSEEYRAPTDQEWEEFLGHFERRRVAMGDCGRAYGTGCVHEHSCLRCSLLRPDPGRRQRIVDIRDNLLARIAGAERENSLGESKDSRSASPERNRNSPGTPATVNLGIPTFRDVASRIISINPSKPSISSENTSTR